MNSIKASLKIGGKKSASTATENTTPDTSDEHPAENTTPKVSDERPAENTTPKVSDERPADETTPKASEGHPAENTTPDTSGEDPADEKTPKVSDGDKTVPTVSLKSQPVTPPKRPVSSVKEPPKPKEEPPKPKKEIPPAPLSPEDESTIAKLRQISQMWQFHPVPPGPEASEARYAAAARCGSARVMGASVRGKKHVHGGSYRDDWFELWAGQEEDVILVAVSDGAGSKKFSRIGAKVSCRAAVESLRESFRRMSGESPELLRRLRSPEGADIDPEARSLLHKAVSAAMRRAQGALYEAFKQRIGDPAYEDLKAFRDLSATLLLAVVIPSPGGEHTVAVCQVGDGAIVLFDSKAPYERAMTLLGTPDSGDYAGETEFMTSPSLTEREIGKRVSVRRLRFDSMLVMTDGVSDDYFPARPELFRLYFDLTANGVLPPGRAAAPGEPLPIPAPLEFPNADAEQTAASLNYAWLIRSATGLSLEDLWRDASPLERASRLLPAREGAETDESRLAYWLEHYVESASFDDRTLVVVRIGEGDEGSGPEENQSGEV